MAIAAAARVPVVTITLGDLMGGEWVGRGAANMRELFKTARETAPVIIYMEDIELIAGVRQTGIDGRDQEYEGMLNQMLVEMDG